MLEDYTYDEIEMVFVEGGSYVMVETNERKTVRSFYIGKYPVTQKQWKDVMGENPSFFTGDDLPVECVSWHDCKKFIERLNEKTGKYYRLPTEAEWEWAARGGIKSKGYKHSGSDNLNTVGWYNENSDEETHSVGKKKANELGIYDMSGNVWEWCEDWYDNDKKYKVVRGGSWYYDDKWYAVSDRMMNLPDLSSYVIGFRLFYDS